MVDVLGPGYGTVGGSSDNSSDGEASRKHGSSYLGETLGSESGAPLVGSSVGISGGEVK